MASLLVACSMCCGIIPAALAHQPELPADYPSHIAATGCTKPEVTAVLQKRLNEYNIIRVEISDVLYDMADSYSLDSEVRGALLGFARLFEQMKHAMPQPSPDSDEFRNFDFRFGLSLTAVTVFLNTRDESLTRQFVADQKRPDSVLSRYLERLDLSRNAYTEVLNKENSSTDTTGACS